MSPGKDLHNKTFNLWLISDYIWSGYNTREINSAMISSWSFERWWYAWNQLVLLSFTFTTYSPTYYPCLNALLGLARRAADSSRVWFGDSLSRRGRDTKQGPWLPGQARPCQLHRGLQCSRALGRGRLAPDQLPQWILFLSLAFSYRKAEQRWRLLLNPVGLSCHCGSAALSNCFSTDTKWHSFANICASCPLPTSKSEAEKVTLIRFHCQKKKQQNTGCIIKIRVVCFSTGIIRQESKRTIKINHLVDPEKHLRRGLKSSVSFQKNSTSPCLIPPKFSPSRRWIESSAHGNHGPITAWLWSGPCPSDISTGGEAMLSVLSAGRGRSARGHGGRQRGSSHTLK